MEPETEVSVSTLTASDLINCGLRISLELAEGGTEDKKWRGRAASSRCGTSTRSCSWRWRWVRYSVYREARCAAQAGPACPSYTLHHVEAASSIALEDIPVMVDPASCSSNTDLSLIHISSPRDKRQSRMPSSA